MVLLTHELAYIFSDEGLCSHTMFWSALMARQLAIVVGHLISFGHLEVCPGGSQGFLLSCHVSGWDMLQRHARTGAGTAGTGNLGCESKCPTVSASMARGPVALLGAFGSFCIHAVSHISCLHRHMENEVYKYACLRSLWQYATHYSALWNVIYRMRTACGTKTNFNCM